jgi:uncharacterized membrane protein
MTPSLFAETYLSWLPVWSTRGFVILLIICAVVWVLQRLFWGASHVRGRFGLLLLRCCTLGILAVILLGPTIVDEQPGKVSRPGLLYVLDGSQSMQLGQEESRWEQCLNFIRKAKATAGSDHSKNGTAYRFGHQLQPLAGPTDSSATSPAVSLFATDNASEAPAAIAAPDASDSRLSDALRQLLPQVNSSTTAGIVLLSDGRVRASDTVEPLAEYFGKAEVPIHVVPTGQATGTGDIAVVSLVVPSRVRKYTENEQQIFLRSFGYTGQSTTVRVKSRNRLTQEETDTLPGLPVTLSGGAQSVSMTFRVDEVPEDFVITVDPIAGELTERNNRVETRVEINRTKVRVLYIEGMAGQSTSFFGGLFGSTSEPVMNTSESLTVRNALQEDEDVECTMLVSRGGGVPTVISGGGSSMSTGFPATRAELFAYDCVVFSNAGPEVLMDEQAEWLSQWVQGRGGGLIVTGSEALRWREWQNSPLEPLLPVSLSTSRPSATESVKVTVADAKHPIWRLRLEERPNAELLKQLPPLSVSIAGYVPKPTADVLATVDGSDAALILAHRAGRGRVLVSTAGLGGTSLTPLGSGWGPQAERVASKFWRNMVYWATEGSSTGRRRLIASSDTRFYRPGDDLTVSATAYDEGAAHAEVSSVGDVRTLIAG